MTAVDMPSPVDRHFGPAQRGHFLGAPFDDLDQEKVLERLGNSSPAAAFRYVVTPNVDHVVRLNGNSLLAPYYEEAWMSLCDSRPITALAHLLSLKLPLVTGSDLTARVFKSVIRDGDLVTLIAANDKIVRDLNTAYPNVRFRAFVPPAGVLTDEVAFRACVDFAARERARFIFIAIGSPQSEKIAHALLHHPDARVPAYASAQLWSFSWVRKSAHRPGCAAAASNGSTGSLAIRNDCGADISMRSYRSYACFWKKSRTARAGRDELASSLAKRCTSP
jgi:UDP-N-acetyl-D-mannosaminuronic acid transferase (WecB/TagA/CpsF family)